jgi:hypothetical protein
MAARKRIFEMIAGMVFLAVLWGLNYIVEPELRLLLFAVIVVSVISIALTHLGMAFATWIGHRLHHAASRHEPRLAASVSKQPQP